MLNKIKDSIIYRTKKKLKTQMHNSTVPASIKLFAYIMDIPFSKKQHSLPAEEKLQEYQRYNNVYVYYLWGDRIEEFGSRVDIAFYDCEKENDALNVFFLRNYYADGSYLYYRKSSF